jgi:hypothetical protein
MFMQPHSKVTMTLDSAKLLRDRLDQLIKADEAYNEALKEERP